MPTSFPMILDPAATLGGLKVTTAPGKLPGGTCFVATEPGDGLAMSFAPGSLVGATHLTFDILVDGTEAGVFAIFLQEGDDGPTFISHFAFLNQCQGRFRLPVEAVKQNRWLYPREGAWLKVICAGDRVDLVRVDRIRLVCYRKGDSPLQWCMTPLVAVAVAPPLLTSPLLPAGTLLDELGQSTLVDWPSKTRSADELVARLRTQSDAADNQEWPESFTRFGGWRDRQFEATGYFRTHHDGRRWWLVDPDGFAFWSAGNDCVRSNIDTNAANLEAALTWSPEKAPGFESAWRRRDGGELIVDYLRTNLIRAFGTGWKRQWARIALAAMRQTGFNTIANWSEWEVASAAGFPYVRPLQWPLPDGRQAPRVFRDFPDVFDPVFAQEAAHYATQLECTRDDAAFIGYFLMNEPTWGFAGQTPAEGILFNCDGGPSREAFATFCRERYHDDTALAAAWGSGMTFDRIARGRWTRPVNEGATADLEAFSTVLVEKLFGTLTAACRAVDPNHLNLGARYFQVPPEWAMQGMGCFDVFSVNGYRERVDRRLADASKAMNCPAMIGEWHFGALDVGLPASGIGRVATQTDRGKAYRIYVEDAATQPWCVGVHHFTLYDQSAMGRFDGENYNIGFLDVCHRLYEPLAEAARASHEALYRVADGQTPPFDAPPEYLPRLFY